MLPSNERRTPTYDLQEVQRLAGQGPISCKVTEIALLNADALGLGYADIIEAVLMLTPAEFHKTMPSDRLPGIVAGCVSVGVSGVQGLHQAADQRRHDGSRDPVQAEVKMDSSKVERCYLCNNVAEIVTERREVRWGTRKVMIDDELYRCSSCGETYYDGFQAEEHNRRTAAAIRAEDGLLAPDEIRVIRSKYGMTQAGLETLIGSGEKTVVRWEHGSVAQNATADTLLRVLRDYPEVVAKLAEERGVKVKLPRPPADRVDGSADADQATVDEVRYAA